MIQEGLNCLETTDYFFTNIEPKPIIVEHPTAHHSTSTKTPPAARGNPDSSVYAYQQASTSPESYRHKNYITHQSTGCIQLSLCLFPWWKRRYPRTIHRVTNYPIAIHWMKRQTCDSVHQKKKETMGC